jgi:hypothetical protein
MKIQFYNAACTVQRTLTRRLVCMKAAAICNRPLQGQCEKFESKDNRLNVFLISFAQSLGSASEANGEFKPTNEPMASQLISGDQNYFEISNVHRRNFQAAIPKGADKYHSSLVNGLLA